MLQNLARGLLAATLAASAALTSTSAAQSPPPGAPAGAKPALKVAFVYVSPIGDAGWTYQHDQARLAMQQALGARVQTSVVEAVAEGADS